MRWPILKRCMDCCRSVRCAKRYAMTRGTGTRLNPTFEDIQMQTFLTGSVPNVSTNGFLPKRRRHSFYHTSPPLSETHRLLSHTPESLPDTLDYFPMLFI